ncbi:MAG: hypothetical protein AAFR96_08955 [Planctomycetota bacterium]
MPLFQAKRNHPVTGADESVYIDAPDRKTAIIILRSHGWGSADWLDHVPPGSDIPDGATVLKSEPWNTPREKVKPLRRVADSGLIRRPILTLAVGIAFGIVGGVVLLWILTFVLGVLGIAVAEIFG